MTITFYAEDEVVGTTEFQLPPPHGVEVPLALSFPGVVRVTKVRIAATGMELYVESFSVYGLRASECVLRSVSEGQCVSCENGLMDGLESSTDCGGTCPTKCQRDQTCNENGDCASGMCGSSRPAVRFRTMAFESRGITNPLPAPVSSRRLSGADTFTDALAAFNALSAPGQASGSYCARNFEVGYDMANQAACTGGRGRGSRTNIGFHYIMPFDVFRDQPTVFEFRMHADWGFGGFTCFGAEGSTKTNDQCTYHGGDIWGHIYFSETISQIGSYEWEAVGFEGCCDGWQKLEVSLPNSCGAGSGWQLVASAAEYGCPIDACYDPSPISTCNDGVQNYIETDVDCGGASCATIGKLCAAGQSCGEDSDCRLGGTCSTTGVCTSCNDGLMNGDEVDVDCGGACGKCGQGMTCYSGDDCAETLFCYAQDADGGTVAGRGAEVGWDPIAASDGSSRVDWDRLCADLPDMAASRTAKITMGHFVDYFRPLEAATACAFFLGSAHLWSNDRAGPFIQLSSFEAGNRYGGSGWRASSDGRDYVSFWGSQNPADLGGCCHTSSEYSGWGAPFDVHVTRTGTCAGRATVDIARANETVSITDGSAIVESLFIRSAPPDGLPD